MMKTLKTYRQLFENYIDEEILRDEAIIHILIERHLEEDDYLEYVKKMNNINQPNKTGITPLLWSIYKFDLPVIKKIVEMGADVNIQNKHGETSLMWAFDDNTLETIDYLTKQGADWNLKTNQKSQSPNMNFIEYCNDVKNRLDNWEDDEYTEKLKVINDPEYPKLMNEYLMKLDLDKFNI